MITLKTRMTPDTTNERSVSSGDRAEPPRPPPLLRPGDGTRGRPAGLPLHAQRRRPVPRRTLPAGGGDEHRTRAEVHARTHTHTRVHAHACHSADSPSALRYWLKGPKAGTKEVAVDNMIGYPDNIRRSDRGTFLVGMTTTRFRKATPPFLDLIAPYPAVKRFLAKVGLIVP